jgi:hypothetical protein
MTDIKVNVKVKRSEPREDFEDTLDDLQYVGFDPIKLRKEIKEAGKVSSVEIKHLLAAYTQIGSKPANAEKKKRKVPRSIRDMLARTGSTLPRLAIAYMPMLLIIRMVAVAKGYVQKRFNVEIPNEFADVAFSGWLGEKLKPFLIAFDDAVKNTDRPERHGVRMVEQYMLIAQNGFQHDEEVAKVITGDRAAIEGWFKSCFN